MLTHFTGTFMFVFLVFSKHMAAVLKNTVLYTPCFQCLCILRQLLKIYLYSHTLERNCSLFIFHAHVQYVCSSCFLIKNIYYTHRKIIWWVEFNLIYAHTFHRDFYAYGSSSKTVFVFPKTTTYIVFILTYFTKGIFFYLYFILHAHLQCVWSSCFLSNIYYTHRKILYKI